MKILHCCLANYYADNFSYQENILPEQHKFQGHTVEILASTETYIDNKVLGYVEPKTYKTNTGITITRIPYSNKLPHKIMRKVRLYKGIYEKLIEFQPEIVFIHGCQFCGIKEIVRYVKQNKHTRVYVDGHADYVNSAKGWISRNILHKGMYKWCAQTIYPYTKKFYGVLPARVDFFIDMYKIPAEKVELLVMGADTKKIEFDNKEFIRKDIRDTLGIKDDDFVIITGGKIDRRKNIHVLMQAVANISIDNIKLIVFGMPNEEMELEIQQLCNSSKIRHIGWIKSEEVYNYFLASDLGFFPGTHSVLWEQAVGTGLPCVFKRWKGIEHIDIGGNCLFIDEVTIDKINEQLYQLINDKILYGSLKDVSISNGIKEFSYYNIAKQAIEEL